MDADTSTVPPNGHVNPNAQSNWQIGWQVLAAVIMWLLAVFGNCLVVLVVHRSRRLQSTTNYFVVSLAMADLLVALVAMPLVVARVILQKWTVGGFLCKAVRFVQYMAPSATVLVLAAICVDRFYTIVHPLSFKVTRGKAKRILFLSWFVAALISSPAFYFFEVSTLNGYPFCNTFIAYSMEGVVYSAFLVSVDYVLPLCTVTAVYARVIGHVWRVGVGGRTLQLAAHTVPRAKVKTVKMLMIVSAVYFILWGPFFVAQLWYAAIPAAAAADGGGGAGEPSSPEVYIATMWLAFASCASNPIVYTCYNPNFRRGCQEVFCMSSVRCYRSNTYAITSSSRFARRNYVGVAPTTALPSPPNGDSAMTPSLYRTFEGDSSGDKKMLAWPLPVGNGQATYL